MTFGRLTVTGRAPERIGVKTAWECLCQCGNRTTSTTDNLTGGGSRSCGCVRSEKTISRNIRSRKFPDSKAASRHYHLTHRDELNRRSRERSIRYTFGITVEQYEKLLSDQGFKCAICKRDLPRSISNRNRKALDHDHKTGKIRDFLCAPCNMAIGQMSESSQRLRAAADYLERHEKEN